MNKTIKLNKNDIKKMVNESVKQILKESFNDYNDEFEENDNYVPNRCTETLTYDDALYYMKDYNVKDTNEAAKKYFEEVLSDSPYFEPYDNEKNGKNTFIGSISDVNQENRWDIYYNENEKLYFMEDNNFSEYNDDEY